MCIKPQNINRKKKLHDILTQRHKPHHHEHKIHNVFFKNDWIWPETSSKKKKKKKSSGSSSFYSFEASSAIEVVEHLIAYLGPPFGSHVSQLYGQIASVLLKTAKF